MDLKDLRDQIDCVDDKIAELYIKRLDLVRQVGEYKKQNNVCIEHNDREQQIYDRLAQKFGDKTATDFLYNSIMTYSKIEQNILQAKQSDFVFKKNQNDISGEKRVGLAGTTGAYAEKAAKKAEKQEEKTEIIGIEDFAKIDLRVGQIKDCAKAENSDKLLVLQVDMGSEIRQVVSGIAKYYVPDELIGKKVIVVSNLKPAKLRGIESNGMILAADTENGVKVLFADENASLGSKVR